MKSKFGDYTTLDASKAKICHCLMMEKVWLWDVCVVESEAYDISQNIISHAL